MHLVAEPISGASSELASALAEAGLPTADLTEPARSFFRFSESGTVVGFGGYELHGDAALLRSIAVLPAHRRKSIGREIVDMLGGRAAQAGARQLFLMTTNARPFFARLGFAIHDRASAPQAVLASRQVAELCPSSAALMSRAATDVSRDEQPTSSQPPMS
jgi:N-acetylglutamate synthase-like GNAT family acetyltransferase